MASISEECRNNRNTKERCLCLLCDISLKLLKNHLNPYYEPDNHSDYWSQEDIKSTFSDEILFSKLCAEMDTSSASASETLSNLVADNLAAKVRIYRQEQEYASVRSDLQSEIRLREDTEEQVEELTRVYQYERSKRVKAEQARKRFKI